jgi:histone H3/H4
MKDIAYAFGYKTEISRLTPNEKIERDIEQLAPRIRFRRVAARFGDPDVRFAAEVRAPVSIVFEEFAAEVAEHGGVE